MDAEVSLNDRRLSYVEEDVQYPLLTRNTMMFLRSNILPERDPDSIDDCQLRKRARHLQKCREFMEKMVYGIFDGAQGTTQPET